MNYQEARAFIDNASTYGSVLGLENMKQLSIRLDVPEADLSFVHIAGTNGKGSVTSYIETILQEAGYRVGKYVSPTLCSYRERIQINKEPISKVDFANCMGRIYKVSKEMEQEGLSHPTPFELETMCAFLYFKEKSCDMVVLECGLGGDTDATNIIQNTKVAVITSISRDHMGYLGDSLEEIAEHKVGIIKDGSKVVTVMQEESVLQIIEQESKKHSAKLSVADGKNIILQESNLEGQGFVYEETLYEITLLGLHQIENAVVAIEGIKALRELGYVITKEQVQKGLKKTTWLGRFSIVGKQPYMIVDGAHNEAAALRLKESLIHYFKGKKLIFLMGVFKDKEYNKVIQLTAPLASHIITLTPPDSQRALSALELAEEVKKYHKSVEVSNSIEDAVNRAYLVANTEDVIIAFGSLSFLDAIIKKVE